ncbi:MAG: ribosome recycling factor [Ruminococcaceae bacterium]|nr:ribosome recycling factor [Oscillospiraceae bacterium]
MTETLAPYEEKMQKTIGSLKNELGTIRAGRANPSVLDRLFVDYYGTPTKINQLASISVAEARMLVIQPYDPSVLKEVVKSIQMSDLGINPIDDGKTIRLVFPQLTEERRKSLVKDVKAIGENSKVAIRSIRREAIDKFKKMEKASEISEDDLKVLENEAQKITDKHTGEIDDIISEKEKEIMEI